MRDLDVVGQAELLADLGDDQPEVLGRQQRRRAPAEEDRRHRRDPVAERIAVAEHVGSQPDLVQHGVGVRAAADARPELGRGVGVEVAVPAPGVAERHVHVHAEADAGRGIEGGASQPPVGRRGITGWQSRGHGSSVRHDRAESGQAGGLSGRSRIVRSGEK